MEKMMMDRTAKDKGLYVYPEIAAALIALFVVVSGFAAFEAWLLSEYKGFLDNSNTWLDDTQDWLDQCRAKLKAQP